VGIELLPDAVINQIAAGEVVERPASVVRELVDNAVDAGATDISVILTESGMSGITVRDNGSGMSRADSEMAFTRHATSKLRQLADLWGISTLGFRGEALASIASVSQVRLRTRVADESVGTEVLYVGGKLLGINSCAWGTGTEIAVNNLFFNTPARKKFLKSGRAELARITSWLQGFSFARPAVRIKLSSDGIDLLSLAAKSDVVERARELFRGPLAVVRAQDGEIAITGGLLHPSLAASDSTALTLLVNGRVVTDKILQRAVREGFDSMLKDREHPFGVIAIQMPATMLDVNVHPQKSEVRFSDPQIVASAVSKAVLEAVRTFRGPVAQVEAPQRVVPIPRSDEIFVAYPPPKLQFGNTLIKETPQYADNTDSTPSVLVSALPKAAEPEFRFSDLRYIGQLLGCYLLCEQLPDRFVVVDMHAAHERINFNIIRERLLKREVKSQKLLIPITVKLTFSQSETLESYKDLLSSIGVEFSIVDCVAHVSAAPDFIQSSKIPELISQLGISEFWGEATQKLDSFIDPIAARLACHASVRGGDQIGRSEAYHLFSELDAAILSSACPHGRPVVTAFNRSAVERWFGRDK
jgi:DNA mismatch repair protein MutL